MMNVLRLVGFARSGELASTCVRSVEPSQIASAFVPASCRSLHISAPALAGHSKWHNIRHRKAAQDIKRSQMFTKLLKKLSSCVREGGSDPALNPRLQQIIENCQAANVPKDKVQNAISKNRDLNQEDVTYEVYGKGGVGILVECVTDKRTRTHSEVGVICRDFEVQMASPNSVLFNFDKKGVLQIARESLVSSEDDIMLAAMDAGATDIQSNNENIVIQTAPSDVFSVKEALKSAGLLKKKPAPDAPEAAPTDIPVLADIEMVPKLLLEVDPDTEAANLALVDAFYEHPDVSTIYHNMKVTPESE